MRLERDARGTVGAPTGVEQPDPCGGHFGWSARARKGCPRARNRVTFTPDGNGRVTSSKCRQYQRACWGLSIPPFSARFLRIREVRYCRTVSPCLVEKSG